MTFLLPSGIKGLRDHPNNECSQNFVKDELHFSLNLQDHYKLFYDYDYPENELLYRYFTRFLPIFSFLKLSEGLLYRKTFNHYLLFKCERVCVCVCLRPSTVKASFIWGWNSRGQINDVVMKTFFSSAKFCYHYFSMKNRAFLTSRFIYFTQ